MREKEVSSGRRVERHRSETLGKFRQMIDCEDDIEITVLALPE